VCEQELSVIYRMWMKLETSFNTRDISRHMPFEYEAGIMYFWLQPMRCSLFIFIMKLYKKNRHSL